MVTAWFYRSFCCGVPVEGVGVGFRVLAAECCIGGNYHMR